MSSNLNYFSIVALDAANSAWEFLHSKHVLHSLTPMGSLLFAVSFWSMRSVPRKSNYLGSLSSDGGPRGCF